MATKVKTESVDAFLKDTPPKKIHENFLSHVNYVLSKARLHKETYFKGIAEQMALKATMISDDHKTFWKLKFIESKKMWMYVAEKVERSQSVEVKGELID